MVFKLPKDFLFHRLSLLIACVMNILNFEFLDFQVVFKTTGTPLALLSVGLQLRFDRKSQHWHFWD
jgi:hypothetical protein